MKFTINKNIILEHLQKILGPTTTKSSSPNLSNILISVNNERIEFVSTDLDITILSFLDTAITDEGGVVVPMKRIFSIIRELPNKEITVEKIKNSLLINCEKIEFKVNTVSMDDFPKIEEKKHTSLIKIDPQELNEMISLTSFCVGAEEGNYVLGGILFEIHEGNIRLVSTDGKRLSFIERGLARTQGDVKSKISFILPLKAVVELQKLIKERGGDVYLFIDKNRVGFDFKDAQFMARPIEGEFPNYRQYIPEENKNKVVVDRKLFLAGLRRALLLSTPDYQGVKISVKKGGVQLSKQTPQLGEVKEDMEVDYDGAPMVIGFNPSYLIDVLKNLTDETVAFEFLGPDKPAVIRRKGYVYLTLPIKI